MTGEFTLLCCCALFVLSAAASVPLQRTVTPSVTPGTQNPAGKCASDGRPWVQWSLMEQAIQAKNLAEVERLLVSCSVDVNRRGYKGNTALHEAIVQKVPGMEDFVALLLAHGADPNLPNYKGETPIHLAAEKAIYPIPIIKLLLDKSADINAKSGKWKTAEDIALHEHRLPVARFLALEKAKRFMMTVNGTHPTGANQNQTQQEGCPKEGQPDLLMKEAIGRNDVTEVKKLVLECGYDVNWRSPMDGNNALHEAARLGQGNMTSFFLEAGAKPDKKNRAGLSALHLAVMSNSIPTMKALLDHGADINIESGGLGHPKLDVRQLANSMNQTQVKSFLDEAYNRWLLVHKDCIRQKIRSMSKGDLSEIATSVTEQEFEHELFDQLEDVLSKCHVKDSAMRQLWIPMAEYFMDYHGMAMPTQLQAKFKAPGNPAMPNPLL